MDVDDEDGDDDGEGDEDHDEEQILPDQRDHLGTNQRRQSAERLRPEFTPSVTRRQFKAENVDSLTSLCTHSPPR